MYIKAANFLRWNPETHNEEKYLIAERFIRTLKSIKFVNTRL